MNEERKQILNMLADGKITADEAAQLLDRLETPGAAKQASSEIPSQKEECGDAPRGSTESRGRLRYLRVVVDGADGERVNVRVPLELVRTGIKLGAMLPQHAREKLDEKGIDLSQLSSLDQRELIEALRELTVDVDSPKGDTVRVFCE